MKKKLISMLLAVSVAMTVLTGCGNTGTAESQSPASGTESGETKESGQTSTDAATTEEITLDIASIISKDIAPNHEPLEKLLKEKFNISVNWIDISSDEQLNLLFSTGNAPDLIQNYNGEGTVKIWGNQGNLYSIDEYLDYIPNYLALFTEDEWNITHTYAANADGKLYYIPTKNYRSSAEAWMYRTGMLEELGKDIPSTTEELYDILKTYKEKYPDAIPIANRWGMGNMLKGFQYAFRTASGFFQDPDSGSFEYGPATDKYRDMLIYVAKLYNEGLIDPEFQTATDTQWQEIYANGLNILEYSYTNRAVWANGVMEGADPDADWQWSSQYVTAYPDKGVIVPKELPYQPWGTLLTKSMSEEEVLRWLQVVDWACTEEGQRWFSMGEEGITYELVDGKPVFLPEIYSVSNPSGKSIEEKGYGYYLIRSVESLEQTGYADDLTLSAENADKESLAFISYALTEEQEKELVDPEMQIGDIYSEYVLRFITGSLNPANDADWNEYLERLDSAGLENVKKIRESVATISK